MLDVGSLAHLFLSSNTMEIEVLITVYYLASSYKRHTSVVLSAVKQQMFLLRFYLPFRANKALFLVVEKSLGRSPTEALSNTQELQIALPYCFPPGLNWEVKDY